MADLAKQYEHNTRPGPDYRSSDSIPDLSHENLALRYIAYYLPQFHAIPENDRWWGKGFTEWSNVTKALPRYLGQFQPRLPGDLGFYDLSNPDHIRAQVDLANRAGIYGFCIHNYWHSGHRLLETPLRLILKNRDINIRFCLNWANESWSRRWDGSDKEILIKQNYAPGEDVQYAEYLAEFFADERYIRIDGRPLVMIYRPSQLPDVRATVERWRELFAKRGLANPYVVFPQTFEDFDPRPYGMDAAAGFPPHRVGFDNRNIKNYLRLLDRRYLGVVFSYDEMVEASIANAPEDFRLLPGVCPQWDNEARRSNNSLSFAGSTPEKYGHWLHAVSKYAMKAPIADERIVFINAWNEWAEGAYLEPDRHYGFAYLAETSRVLQDLSGISTHSVARTSGKRTPMDLPVERLSNYLRNIPSRVARRSSRLLGRG